MNATRPGSTPSPGRRACVLLGFFWLALALSYAALTLMGEEQLPVVGPAAMTTAIVFFPWLRAHGRASLGAGAVGAVAAFSLLDVFREHAERLTADAVTCAVAAVPAVVVYGVLAGRFPRRAPR